MYSMLMYRMIVFNLVCSAGVVFLYLNGWLLPAFLLDASYISYGIVVLLAYSIFANFVRAFKLSSIKAISSTDSWYARFDHIEDVGAYLVTLGLIGTAIGILIAISGVDFTQISTVAGVEAMSGTLISGMKTAIYTTIVGSFAWIWHNVMFRMNNTALRLISERENDGQ